MIFITPQIQLHVDPQKTTHPHNPDLLRLRHYHSVKISRDLLTTTDKKKLDPHNATLAIGSCSSP